MANAPLMARRMVNAKKAVLFKNTAALKANFERAAERGEVVDLGILFIGYSLDVVGGILLWPGSGCAGGFGACEEVVYGWEEYGADHADHEAVSEFGEGGGEAAGGGGEEVVA